MSTKRNSGIRRKTSLLNIIMSDDFELQYLGPVEEFPTYGNFYRTESGYILTDAIGGPYVRKWLKENFEAREDDIYVVSFPKTGTTWAQELVYVIANDCDFEKTQSDSIIARFPYLELKQAIENNRINNLSSPRFIKSHYPYSLLPKSIDNKKCKVIYTIRNPKDTVVSYYHFVKMIRGGIYNGDLETFVNCFIENKRLGYTPFWKHVLEIWELRHQENILILKYEDMKKDFPKEVKRVASFLGKTLTNEEIVKITEHCSFKSMKENPNTNYVKELGKGNTEFMRKGEVGDWKNFLTKEMNQKLDNYCEKYFNCTGLEFTFEL